MAKSLSGTVVSTKMLKTVIVLVERKLRHPKYRKVITRHKKYKAHNEDKAVKVGDTVWIRECRPISREKHFIVVENKKPASPAKPASQGERGEQKSEVKVKNKKV